ncbi:MAG: serine/threonine protein kinase, partial [Myxococcales bacterium]|nr:serine/threonine protein kinase [Myxococcales bacterium]
MAVSLREVLSFGRYEPLFRIASGGMAEVYAAQIQGEAGFQKLVAVKRMHPHLAHDQSFVDMFLNEARLAAHVTSPHVVQTMDLGRGSDGSLYIVMELVVGVSLATLEVASQAALPVPIALELVAQAAHGLDDAHDAVTPAGDELGLIHRDVSPHNILVGIDGRAKVTDFGIARAVHAPRTETNVKELKGKFAYMSPEQTRLHRLDRRSDIFSLGIVLWEALVGRRLFAERDPADCIRNVRKKVIPPPHELDPHIPPAISKVVLTALERMPSARYQTGADFADALRRVGRDELGRLPDRKTIAAFVKEAGGEELERLQRLIRLGTEGAASEAMEAVRPGSTMVLGPGDASGVARVGTTRTDEMDPTSLPKIATVILPDEEEERLGSTATEADLDDADL